MNFGVTDKKSALLLQRMEAVNLKESDLEESFVRSCGPGGQKVNKTSTCVRLTHTPTGLTVKAQKARTQLLNRYYARKQLCELMEQRRPDIKSPNQIKQEKIAKQKQRRKRRSKKISPGQ